MSADDQEQDVCWICLCNGDDIGGEETVRVCSCPRVCHKRCLGRWQLQNAGKREEKFCRFCEQGYPDWRSSLTPGEITPSTPVMAVSVRGKVYKLRVRPGPEGKEDFKRQIRQLLGFSTDMDFDVIFECKTPHNGSEKVQLHGFEAFEAASWCAAVSAAKRKQAKAEKAAKAAAAAAAGTAPGGSLLATTVTCPAALDAGGSSGRPSSSSSGASSTASDESIPSGISSGAGPASAMTHTSAFARGQQAAPGGLLLHSGAGASATLQPAGSSFLQTAGSSMPHAIIEEPLMPASPPAGTAAVLADVTPQRGGDQDSCPHGLALHLGLLAPAMSVPVIGSDGALALTGRSGSRSGAARGGSSSRRGSSDDGGRDEDGSERRGGGKVPRWLRRVLHLGGPWHSALPASLFMGII